MVTSGSSEPRYWATTRGTVAIVIDVDPDHGGDETLADLEGIHGRLPDTVEAIAGSGGRHIYFKHPGIPIRNSASRLGPGIDVRGDGSYVIAPPSLHRSGSRYAWEVSSHPDDAPLAEVPAWLMKLMVGGRAEGKSQADPVDDDIPEGQGNATLASLAGTMRRRGMSVQEILAALLVVNASRCKPPQPEAEVRRIAESVGRCGPSANQAGRAGAKWPEPMEDAANTRWSLPSLSGTSTTTLQR
jgi:hypothetical protein